MNVQCHLPKWVNPDTGECEHLDHDTAAHRRATGKTRRPIGMRGDVPAYDPREDGMGAVAFFEYREDALEAGREWVEPQGYLFRVQYFGRYDLWALEARRKSWRGPGVWVEACRNPEAVVTRHAHVPAQHAYREAVTA